MVQHSFRHSLIAAASEASNEPLKKRFNVEKLPAIRFVSEKTKVVYSYEGAENAEEVVQFVQTSISPALRNLAELAKKFLGASDKKSLLAEAKKVTATLGTNDAECVSLCSYAPSLTSPFTSLGKLYVASMERVIEKGNSYISTEVRRGRLFYTRRSWAPRLTQSAG